MIDPLVEAYEDILDVVLDGRVTDGTRDTPRRAADALREMTSGYGVDLDAMFTVFDAEGYDEMIAVRDVPFTSLCEHHLLPFEGKAHVAYLPGEKIVGLSKIPRLVDAYARRLQNQERLTMQVANEMESRLEARGVMVVCEASHSCMRCRGIRSEGQMVTSAIRGVLRERTGRMEALALIAIGKS